MCVNVVCVYFNIIIYTIIIFHSSLKVNLHLHYITSYKCSLTQLIKNLNSSKIYNLNFCISTYNKGNIFSS